MNVYDFDGTIYNGDSTRDFYIYLVLHYKKVLKYLMPFLLDVVRHYGGHIITKTKMKETLYKFLKCFNDDEIENIVNDFWKINEKKIYSWYYDLKKDDDVIISASPDFLLKPICKKLNVNLICSKVNIANGDYIGINCYGEEKVRRFYEIYKDGAIDKFYSDSKSDEPLAKLAKSAYIVVKNGSIKIWKMKS